jgi:hypothetical protein
MNKYKHGAPNHAIQVRGYKYLLHALDNGNQLLLKVEEMTIIG